MQNLDVMKRQLPSSYNPAQAAKLLNRKVTARDRLREKRIEEIVEVAVELFAKEGASGFSMRRVASLAGVTLSTVGGVVSGGGVPGHGVNVSPSIRYTGPSPEAA